MQKQYKYIKKVDDYGEVNTIAMILTITNDVGQKAVLKAMHVVGESEKDFVSSMTDLELTAYTQKILDSAYSDQDIFDAFNVQPPAPQIQGA